ncbi:TonB-dependent receptor plug domain-containing protein [Flagellimonas olearia]|uniref:TonB-dependent receptor plug domain-containing protein n=1 Tax=Flagellimonas olearia TaxID=552546 RepID=A0A6I1E3T9_9FLAO|nr:TonB-dependent receptor [Allomuricauda olearia]KAB7531099.1 TonB-dependent receptor plug domain-containing protein [Allomuricauda olearia]
MKQKKKRHGPAFWLLGLCLLLGTMLVQAQNNFTISGKISDGTNGETLFGTSIFLRGTDIGAISNEYGFYSISAPKGTYTLVFSYIGYNEMTREVTLDQNMTLDVELLESSTQLDEVEVTAEEPERALLRKPEMSVSKLNIKTVKQMPVVLGEVDIIKSLQILPGVTNNGEGSSGFHVRGGAVDQNLVLLDEAIIYNTSHLLGFFSVFNADAVKDLKLYKGGIPARFGGRVSSVLDVRQKDGNSKAFAMTGGIGAISSRLALEGPMFNDRGSFLIAGRGSYAHLFLKLAGEDNSANFYDLNLKTNYNLNPNNKLYLSGYFGRDLFNIGGSFSSSYGNASGNLRWNHIFNDRLFSNLSLIYSNYDYELGIDFFDFDWVSSIQNYNVKYDLKYYFNDAFKLDFGVSTIKYVFDPGRIKPTDPASAINELQLDKKRALESAAYINAEHKLTDRLTAQYGIRFSHFNRMGGQPLNEYQDNRPLVYNSTLRIYERQDPIDEISYKKSESIETFSNLEPRVSLAYQLNELSSVKLGYSRAAQYIHLLSNTSSVTPIDVWTPSGKYIQPQLSDQFAFGYFKNFKGNVYSMEVETFYKTVDNRIDYIDGSDLIGNNTIEREILNGESKAYGVELLLRKNEGAFTGWLAYTWSKSQQRTPGGDAGGPGINNGDWYSTPHDRTHDVSLTGAYALNEKWSFGANAIFQTGRPVTYPNGQYQYEGISVASYSDRNANRLPAYHRLDVSATYRPNRKPQNRWKGEWVFGIYNVFNRRNAASISFGQNMETGANEATRTAIFGIVPSVTYNFKF